MHRHRPAPVTYDGDPQTTSPRTVHRRRRHRRDTVHRRRSRKHRRRHRHRVREAGDATTPADRHRHLHHRPGQLDGRSPAPERAPTTGRPDAVHRDGHRHRRARRVAHRPYTDNTNAGTATASATYAGDANHTGSPAARLHHRQGRAARGHLPRRPFIYTGSPTPLHREPTGAGSLIETHRHLRRQHERRHRDASARTPGTPTTPATPAASFTIDKATSAVTLICTSPVTYTGAALEPCSAKATGAGVSTSPHRQYGRNTNAGTATATASYTGDANHEGSSPTTFTIVPTRRSRS